MASASSPSPNSSFRISSYMILLPGVEVQSIGSKQPSPAPGFDTSLPAGADMSPRSAGDGGARASGAGQFPFTRLRLADGANPFWARQDQSAGLQDRQPFRHG
jgi:hypothetical protein